MIRDVVSMILIIALIASGVWLYEYFSVSDVKTKGVKGVLIELWEGTPETVTDTVATDTTLNEEKI